MQYYVVTFTHTKIVGWAIYLYAHVRYLKKLLKEDKLQISGPGVGTPVRSAQLVFKVTDKSELDKLVAGDPYSIHGLVASSTENLWDVRWGNMEKPASPDSEGTKYFRATYELKSAGDGERYDSERDEYMKKLLKDKKMRAAGPYVNNPSAGLSILSVSSREEAEEIMKNDPYVKQLDASYQIIQWDPKFGDFK